MTRDDFVAAGELQLFEQVVTIDGQIWRLTSITPRAGPETVYNFEVAREHVYYVGSDGLLVHNLYAVYVIKNANGKVVYAGITSGALLTRALKHGARLKDAGMTGYNITMVAKGLSKAKARGLEQKLIEKFGGPALARGAGWSSKHNGLLNKAWSYAGSNKNYDKYNEWFGADKWMDEMLKGLTNKPFRIFD